MFRYLPSVQESQRRGRCSRRTGSLQSLKGWVASIVFVDFNAFTCYSWLLSTTIRCHMRWRAVIVAQAKPPQWPRRMEFTKVPQGKHRPDDLSCWASLISKSTGNGGVDPVQHSAVYMRRHWKGLTKGHGFGWNSSSNPQNRRGPLNRRQGRYVAFRLDLTHLMAMAFVIWEELQYGANMRE